MIIVLKFTKLIGSSETKESVYSILFSIKNSLKFIRKFTLP